VSTTRTVPHVAGVVVVAGEVVRVVYVVITDCFLCVREIVLCLGLKHAVGGLGGIDGFVLYRHGAYLTWYAALCGKK